MYVYVCVIVCVSYCVRGGGGGGGYACLLIFQGQCAAGKFGTVAGQSSQTTACTVHYPLVYIPAGGMCFDLIAHAPVVIDP